VQQLRKLIELLRAIREAVKEYGRLCGLRSVLVEPRIGAWIDRRIGGVAGNERVDFVARSSERYTKSSRRMRA
jgi:hypothetical protein